MIDDHEAALEIVREALKRGKAVVTANKRMVAANLAELMALQHEYKAPLLYEAACCASIPIIRNLEEYYDNDLVNAVEGIFNGSTNYILTKMFSDKTDYHDALKEAQTNGFAESDPNMDVAGFDTKFKLLIILAHAFGIVETPGSINALGINKIKLQDIEYAREKGYKIKLKAFCRKNGSHVNAIVAPQFVKSDNELYNVENEFNGVVVEGAFSEHQLFIGKGAGSNPTGSAVLSDISALSYDYKYEYKKLHQQLGLKLSNNFDVKVYLSYGEIVPDIRTFLTVDETYRSNGYGYITGTVNINRLKESGLLHQNDISLIILPEK